MTSSSSALTEHTHTYRGENAASGGAGTPQTDLRPVEHQFVEVVEAERRRLGREFHDGLGQRLTSLALSGAILAEKLELAGRPEMADARKLVSQIDEAIRETRSLVRGLYPAWLVQHGLEVTLSDLLSRIQEVSGCATELVVAEGWQPPTGKNEVMHIFRIVQEAVNNALKHGNCSMITVRLDQTDEQRRVEISDNGKGISSRETTGFGLRLMRSRAELIGGRITIDSASGRGTVVALALDQVQVRH